MMLNIPYYYEKDLEYANKRLSSTYVLTTDKKLMSIHSLAEGPGSDKDPSTKVYATGLKIGFEDNLREDSPNYGLPLVTIPVKELNLAPIQLGYIFSTRAQRAIYLSRFPMRSIYKQGLHPNALKFSMGNKNSLSPKDLLAPAYNSYPELKMAYALAVKQGTTVPFCRAFAVGQDGKIEYLGVNWVGTVNKSDNKLIPILDPKFAFLQQHLDWSLNDKRT